MKRKTLFLQANGLQNTRDYYLNEKDIANAQAKLDILEWKFADDQAECAPSRAAKS